MANTYSARPGPRRRPGQRPTTRPRPRSGSRYTPTPDSGDRSSEQWWQMNRMIDAGMPIDAAIAREYHGATSPPIPPGTAGGFPARQRVNPFAGFGGPTWPRPASAYGWTGQGEPTNEAMLRAMLTQLLGYPR